MEVTEKNRTKYRMPGEFEPHEGCVMIWPERPGSWNYGAREAQKAFVKVAEAIGVSEKVYMLVSKAQMENAKNQLGNVSGVTLLECETDDAWARDVGATMVLDEKGAVCGDSDCYRGLSSESGTQSSDEQGTDRGTVEVLARCPQDYLASMWNLSG